MPYGTGQTNRLATIPRGFMGLNWNDTQYCSLLSTPITIFRTATGTGAVTSFGVYSPYANNSDMAGQWENFLQARQQIGDTVYYDKNVIDLSLYNVKGYFLKQTVTGEWTIENTLAYEDLYCYNLTVDEITNSVNIKIKPNFTPNQAGFDDFKEHYYVLDNSTQGVSYYCLFFEEKTPVTKYTVTQNLTNVISDFTGTQVNENETITINLSVNTGYVFTSTPTYTIGGVTSSFTQTAAGYTATITATGNITVTATAALKQCSITQNLTNVSSDYAGTAVTYGTTITVNLTANSGYNFTSTPSYTMGGNTYNFLVGQYGYTATITITDDVIITATAAAITQYRLNLTLTNCTCNYEAGLYNSGTVLNIVLTATGTLYGFTDTPVIISGGNSYPFTVSSDKKTATLQWTINGHCTVRGTAVEGTAVRKNLVYCYSVPDTFPLYFAGETINFSLFPVSAMYEFQDVPTITLYYFEGRRTFEGVAQTDGSFNFSVTIASDLDLEDILIEGRAGLKTVTSKHGLINIYSPTIKELENLAGVRFQNGVDLGQYIISLRRMYCSIPILGRDVIDLGYYFSTVETSVINTDFIVLDCGEVEIGEIYNNGFDYAPNSKAEIFLPLIGFNSLDVNKIMDKEITLSYHFNIVTNTVTAILKAGNEVLETWTGKGGYNVPYIYNAYTGGLKADIDDIPIILAGFTPFIRITSNVPYYPTSTDTDAKDTKKYCRIGDNGGYAQFEEVDFNSTGQITSIEIQELKNLLNSGVVLPVISS